MNTNDIRDCHTTARAANSNLIGLLIEAIEALDHRLKLAENRAEATRPLDPVPNLEERVLDAIRDRASDVAEYLGDEINSKVEGIIDDKMEARVEDLVSDAIYNLDKGDFVRDGLRDII